MANRDNKGQFIEGHKGFRNGALSLLSRKSQYFAHKLFDSLKEDGRLGEITKEMDIKDVINLIKVFTPKDLNINHSGNIELKPANIIINGK